MEGHAVQIKERDGAGGCTTASWGWFEASKLQGWANVVFCLYIVVVHASLCSFKEKRLCRDFSQEENDIVCSSDTSRKKRKPEEGRSACCGPRTQVLVATETKNPVFV